MPLLVCISAFVYSCVCVMVSLVGLRGHNYNIAGSSDSVRIICNCVLCMFVCFFIYVSVSWSEAQKVLTFRMAFNAQNFLDKVRKSFSRQKKVSKLFLRQKKVRVNSFCDKKGA